MEIRVIIIFSIVFVVSHELLNLFGEPWFSIEKNTAICLDFLSDMK